MMEENNIEISHERTEQGYRTMGRVRTGSDVVLVALAAIGALMIVAIVAII